MAGSWHHIIDDSGRFRGEGVYLDDLGDALEALEECYGMIQWLTNGDVGRINQARAHYKDGLKIGGVVAGGER